MMQREGFRFGFRAVRRLPAKLLIASSIAPCMLAVFATTAAAAVPYATHVESYIPGSGVNAAYTDPGTALGEPSRFTPDASFPSVVSMVSAPFLNSQIVQLGGGGSLTLRFDEPITNSPSNPYGMDLIVFGNSFFTASYPDGVISNPAALFGDGTGRIEVSPDGLNFFEISNVFADRLFPTQAYLDSGPFDATPGTVPADFRRPVNPALTLGDFDGLTFAQALALYDGSGGGTSVDIATAIDALGQPAGLSSISYVRITNAGLAPLEIDALVAVPEPMTAGLLVPLVAALGLRRKSRF